MSDTECPYCQADVEINHDDGYGYDEGTQHEQECGDCGKNFTFMTSISYCYYTAKADCLNGSPHRTKPWERYPDGIYPDAVRCKDCEWEDAGRFHEEVYDKWLDIGRKAMADRDKAREEAGRCPPNPTP